MAQIIWSGLFALISLLWIIFDVFDFRRPRQTNGKAQDEGSEVTGREDPRQAESNVSARTGTMEERRQTDA